VTKNSPAKALNNYDKRQINDVSPDLLDTYHSAVLRLKISKVQDCVLCLGERLFQVQVLHLKLLGLHKRTDVLSVLYYVSLSGGRILMVRLTIDLDF
jgi:hypothetical protein